MSQKKSASLRSVVATAGKPAPVAQQRAAKAGGAALERKASPDAKSRGLSYGGLVKKLAKDYGVSVGKAPAATPNPYRLNISDTEKAMRKAGIHTRTGKLTTTFK